MQGRIHPYVLNTHMKLVCVRQDDLVSGVGRSSFSCRTRVKTNMRSAKVARLQISSKVTAPLLTLVSDHSQ